MKIAQFCIERPVFATVINLLIMLCGVLTFKMLTVREFPNVSIPVVNVETVYAGANAEIIENQITSPIEDALSGIEGVGYISSQTVDERSQVSLHFKPSRNIDDATNDVRDSISRIKKIMPKEADDSVISKVEADSNPIIWLAFSSDKHNMMEISDYAERFVKDKIAIIPGVASVRVVGERRYAMRIWLDNEKLAAQGVTAEEVSQSLVRQNVEIPSGRIESLNREFSVLAKTELVKPHEFENIVVKQLQGYLVRLKDVARVEIGARDDRFIARYNGNNTLGMGIVKQSTANPLEIANDLKGVMATIAQHLPEGMRVDLAYDSTENIRQSIHAVNKALVEALVLVVLVIFFFLRSFRATIIPVVTIPLALIGAFSFMYMLNFSINTLTLLAMVLAIGLVVDDAIVVVENIYRHIEEGLSPIKAAKQGMKEISSAVVAMTLTLVAVFLPLAFSEGRIGKLFTEFALVLAASVLISGFTALTLSPMMCSRLLKHEPNHSKMYLIIERWLEALTRSYKKGLDTCLHHRKWVMVFLISMVIVNGVLFKTLHSELVPREDSGFAIALGIAPEGSTKEYTDSYAWQAKPMVEAIPEIERYFYVVGYPNVTQAFYFLGLKDWNKRTVTQADIVQKLSAQMYSIPGILAFAVNPPSGLEEGGFGGPVEFVVQVSGSNEDLRRVAGQVIAKARQNPKLLNVDSNLKIKKPQILVRVDRDKAASSGVSVDTIGHSLNILLGGQQITHFQQNGKQYDVVVQAEASQRFNPEDILNIRVRTEKGEMVALSNFADIEESITAVSLNHFNKLRSVSISAALAPGYSLEEALGFLRDALDEAKEVSAQYDYSGASRNFMQSSGTMVFTFMVALLVIYLVLAAQFESIIDPLVIMFSVPLGIVGALGVLHLVGGTLNVFSQIGLVTLIGLITKHGVLIVQFANQLLAQGKEASEAVLEAAVLRLRPILMTTGATILGALPLAMAVGAGAGSRQQIGWVVVGGMFFGTMLTLFVVPAMYVLLSRFKAVKVIMVEQ